MATVLRRFLHPDGKVFIREMDGAPFRFHGQGEEARTWRFPRRKSGIFLKFPAVNGEIPSSVRSNLPCNLHFGQKRGDGMRRFSQRGAEGVNSIETHSDGVENLLFFQSGKRWG